METQPLWMPIAVTALVTATLWAAVAIAAIRGYLRRSN